MGFQSKKNKIIMSCLGSPRVRVRVRVRARVRVYEPHGWFGMCFLLTFTSV